MKKIAIISGGLGSLAIATILGVSSVGAQSDTTGIHTKLIAKIAAKFNLKQEDVQKVFDDNRQEVMKSNYDAQLKLVEEAQKAGKLTSEQVDLFKKLEQYRIDNAPSMDQNKEDFKSLSETERKQRMDERKAAEAKAVGTTVEKIEALRKALRDAGVGFMGKGMHGGRGKMGPGPRMSGRQSQGDI